MTDQTFFIDKSFNPPPFRRSLDAGSLTSKSKKKDFIFGKIYKSKKQRSTFSQNL